MIPEFKHYPDLDALSHAAADFVCTLAKACVEESGLFTVALAGGKTPKTAYENLAQSPFEARMPWSRTHLFWGDERCVPPDHPDSNFGMAFGAMISRVPLPPGNIHRIPGEIVPPEEAAGAYEKILREFFRPVVEGHSKPPSRAEREDFPVFDLMILGLGRDGHTASIFPEDSVLKEKYRWVAAVTQPRGSPPVPRITLTLPVINRAGCVVFMVSGVEKKDVLNSIARDQERVIHLYPAARIRPEGRVLWFLDDGTLG